MQDGKLDINDKASIEVFMEKHKKLAISIARKHQKRGNIELDDLEQEAMYGLYLATIRFDTTSGNKFSTFAVPTINGTVLKYIRDKEYDIRVPRTKKMMFFRFKELEMKIGTEQAVELLDLTEEEVAEMSKIDLLVNQKSINYTIKDKYDSVTGSMELGDSIQSPGVMEDDVVSDIAYHEMLNLVGKYLGKEYIKVLEMKADGRTYSEITEATGYSYSHLVRKIEEAGQLLLEKYI